MHVWLQLIGILISRIDLYSLYEKWFDLLHIYVYMYVFFFIFSDCNSCACVFKLIVAMCYNGIYGNEH